jgi:hypothetical protein
MRFCNNLLARARIQNVAKPRSHVVISYKDPLHERTEPLHRGVSTATFGRTNSWILPSVDDDFGSLVLIIQRHGEIPMHTESQACAARPKTRVAIGNSPKGN